MSQVSYRAARSIKPKEVFGEPKAILATDKSIQKDGKGLPVDGQRVMIGAVYGAATKLLMHIVKNPEGEEIGRWPVAEGNFEAIAADPARPVTQSPKVFLPDHILNLMRGELQEKDDNGDFKLDDKGQPVPTGNTLEFAFEVSIVTKQSVAAGFVWDYTTPMKPKTHDPFEAMRRLVDPRAGMRQLAAPASTESETSGPLDQSRGRVEPAPGDTPFLPEEGAANETKGKGKAGK